MAIEKFEEIPAYLEANKDNEEVKKYIGGFITPDRVNSFLESDDGKKLLQPKLDGYATKAVQSHDKKFKETELQKLIDAEVKKRYPDKDPKDTEIANLKAEFEKMQKDAARKDITNKALKVAQEKKLPTDLIDYIVSDDEETTMKNMDKLTDIFAKHDEAIKTELLKGNSYTPPKGGGDPNAKKALEDEVSKYFK